MLAGVTKGEQGGPVRPGGLRRRVHRPNGKIDAPPGSDHPLFPQSGRLGGVYAQDLAQHLVGVL